METYIWLLWSNRFICKSFYSQQNCHLKWIKVLVGVFCCNFSWRSRQTLVWTHVHVDVYNMADVSETNSGSSQPNNPLSRKLNKVLETRLDNDKVWNSRDTFNSWSLFVESKESSVSLQNGCRQTRKNGQIQNVCTGLAHLWLQYDPNIVSNLVFFIDRSACRITGHDPIQIIPIFKWRMWFSAEILPHSYILLSTPGCQLWPIKGAFALCAVQSGVEPYSCQNGPDCCLHCIRQSRVLSDWICQIYIVSSSKWHDWLLA